MSSAIIPALVLMGFTSLVAQTLLIRELLIIFQGNELSIGIILANWLILEATGSGVIGRIIDKLKKKARAFALLQLFISIYLPLAIYLTRIAKNIMGTTPGEGLGLLPIFYSSFLILAPLSLCDGTQFTFGCRLYATLLKKDVPSIARVYILEALGFIAGGLIFTYLLIPYFHSLQIALSISVLNLFSASWLVLGSRELKVYPARTENKPWLKNGKKGEYPNFFRIFPGLLILLLGCSIYLLFSGKINDFHLYSLTEQWRRQEVKHYQNSIYGNITVTQQGEQYTFFADGIPIITTPVPDIVFIEEFVHLPLLFHPLPEEVLLVSGGAGVLSEILKHPVERVDYAELDPLIIEMVKKFSTPLTQKELNDPRVKIKHIDGRLFVKTTPHRYDLVMINLPFPSTLQLNRFYTREFFQITDKILKEKGILVISSPGSLTYLSDELRDLNACIYQTLKKVFPYIRVIPGDFNLFLASRADEIPTLPATTLIQRLKERALSTRLLTPFHIKYKLHSRWLNWFFESLRINEKVRVNQDLLPSGLFYGLSLWNALFSPYLKGFFRLIQGIALWMFIIPLSIFILTFLFIQRLTLKLERAPVPFAIVTTGFAGMTFDLILILAFQSFYGYVYHQIGLLTSAFMVGLTIGSLLITRSLGKIKKDILFLCKIELGVIIFSLTLPLLLVFLHSFLEQPLIFASLQVLFLFLSTVSGILVGSEFPLANKIYLATYQPQGKVAGTLYASDLLGAWIGALGVSIVLIPVLGIVKTCLLVTILKISSLVLLVGLPTFRRWRFFKLLP